MYTLRFHFVNGGYHEEKITTSDINSVKIDKLNKTIMQFGIKSKNTVLINLHNVTMIEIIEQED